MVHGSAKGTADVFNRAAGDPEVTLTGAAIPGGSRLVPMTEWGTCTPAGLEGTKLYRVHTGSIIVCHDRMPDPWGTAGCTPLGS